MTRKAIIVIIICVVAAVAIIGTTVGVSLAIWTENKHSSLYVEFEVTKDNASLKYQMYVPIKSSGEGTTTSTSAYEKIPGEFSVDAGVYSYELENPSDFYDIVGFALVGWFGGVALDELQIPETVICTVDGGNVEKPVLRIMVDKQFEAYSFGGDNTVIKKITVGQNVIEVDSGAFCGMASLETVILENDEGNDTNYIYLRPYSFGSCPKLTDIRNRRNYVEGWENGAAFYESGVK